MAAAKTTTDHDEIRKWVEGRGGWPARVKATGRGKSDPGILRIDYPGGTGEDTLVEMSWDDWFKQFDANGLAFLYQPRTRFSKLINRPKEARSRTRTTKVARASTTAGSRSSSPARSRTGRGSSSGHTSTTARSRPKTTRAGAKRSTRSSRSRSSARS